MNIQIRCLFNEMISVDKLKPHPKNNNKHTKEQIERLAKILEYQGWRYPIKISSSTGFITSGHARLEAAKLLGLLEVPVNYQAYESDEQEYADITSDNAIASWAVLDLSAINLEVPNLGPDFDIDLLGINNFKIDLIENEGLTDGDSIPEVKESICKPGDIWQLGNHRLMCGDSTSIDAVEKLMNGEKADMVFTDPPYGINEETDRDFASRTRMAKGNTFSKIIGDDSIDTALGAFSVCDTLSNTICYWGGNYYAHKLPPSPCWIVWDKRVNENQRDMNSDCELAYIKHPTKKSVRIFRHLWKGMIKESEHGRARIHPTQKPIALAEWCFQELNPDGRSVADLFGGSGSTLIACEKTNRKCFMMELDAHYCDVIVKRWEEFTGNKATLLPV